MNEEGIQANDELEIKIEAPDVEAMEAELATRLFDRNRDGYSLTEAGQAFASSVLIL